MKKVFFAAFALTLAFPILANAGKVVTDSLESKILGETVKFNVYLPSGFASGEKTYPVVYLLHGLYGDYSDWQNNAKMNLIADELITSGEAREMVIIMPNAGDFDVRNVQNGYFNVENWNYEDFFFLEFIPAVESKYRIVGDKGHRAIMGLSMGGGGSVVYCQKHPDMFSSCYAMSAWLDDEGFYVGREGMKKDKLYIVCQSVCDNSAIGFLDKADEKTIDKLKTVKWFIDCGDDDFLFDLSVKLHQQMKKHKIKSELRIRDGVHNWEYWHNALRLALPFASRNFDK